MKKQDFIKAVSENDNVSDIIKTISDKENLETAKETLKNLEDIDKKLSNMGLNNLGELKNIEEDFVNTKVFSIIAESETPKISKHELLEFLNQKK